MQILRKFKARYNFLPYKKRDFKDRPRIPNPFFRLLIYLFKTFFFIKIIPTANIPAIAIPIVMYFTTSSAPNGGTIEILSDNAVSGSPIL